MHVKSICSVKTIIMSDNSPINGLSLHRPKASSLLRARFMQSTAGQPTRKSIPISMRSVTWRRATEGLWLQQSETLPCFIWTVSSTWSEVGAKVKSVRRRTTGTRFGIRSGVIWARATWRYGRLRFAHWATAIFASWEDSISSIILIR